MKTSAAASALGQAAGTRQAKRLMVLGAGPSQTPGIRKAVAAGCHVVTVDPYSDSIGHRISQERVQSDTRDEARVLEAAARLGIDGICTFRSDVAIGTVHYVRAQLDLPGASVAAASTMAHKGVFREFQSAVGMPHPRFVWSDSVEALPRSAVRLCPPLWCKPVDNCGSRGISRIDDASPLALRRAIERARGYSRCGAVCVEENAPGVEVGGDAILVGGHIVFIAVTQKYLERGAVTGHRLPSQLADGDRKRVQEAVGEAATRLGYLDGPVNFDVMVSESAVTLLEMSPRNGGNGITDLIRHGHGVDVEEAMIRLALGEAIDLRPHPGAGTGVRLLGSARVALIVRLPDLEAWQRRCNAIFDVFYSRREGEVVQPFEDNGNAIGYVVFRCDCVAEYERRSEEIDDLCSTLFDAG